MSRAVDQPARPSRDRIAPARSIEISGEIAEQLRKHVLSSYPSECCGLLFSRRDSNAVGRIVPMENIQDRLHALDPVANPRTSRDGFEMDALKMAREVERACADGERLVAIYHSHVDCDVYFSERDIAAAAPPPDRKPHDDSLWHVVVACWPDGIRHARAFRWDGSKFAASEVRGVVPTGMPPGDVS